MFKAREATIRQLFDNGEYDQFVVPASQRSYVWGDDELENFWADFLTRTAEQGQLHLIGSIIISKTPNDPKKFGVVDGQQRLITSSLAIAALRDVWGANFGFADTDYYNLERYIVKNDRSKGTVLKVKVAETIRNAYESIIVAKQLPDTKFKTSDEKSTVNAYRYFYSKYEELIKRPGLQIDAQKNLLWTKLENLFNSNAVIITLEDEDDAYEVFEGFNARGVELSIADLFKNLIIQKVGGTEQQKDDALAKWEEINLIIRELTIPKFNINTYLRYFWIQNHPYIGEKELYKRIKKDTTDYHKLLSHLHKSAINLKTLFSDNQWDIKELLGSDPKQSNSINESIRALRVMNTQSYMVWLMALTDNETREFISPRWIAKALREVEVFSFRYFGISKLPANKIEKFYAKLSRELWLAIREKNKGKIETQVLNSFSKAINIDKLLPSKEEFIIDFEAIALQSNNKPFIRYLLSTIENRSGTSEKIVDQQAVNIEHILPQKPNREWNISPTELKESVNRLGNLTILLEKINSSVGNKPIKQKVVALANSQLDLNRLLIEAVEKNGYIWGPLQIGNRQLELAQLADNIWKLQT